MNKSILRSVLIAVFVAYSAIAVMHVVFAEMQSDNGDISITVDPITGATQSNFPGTRRFTPDGINKENVNAVYGSYTGATWTSDHTTGNRQPDSDDMNTLESQ